MASGVPTASWRARRREADWSRVGEVPTTRPAAATTTAEDCLIMATAEQGAAREATSTIIGMRGATIMGEPAEATMVGGGGGGSKYPACNGCGECVSFAIF